MNKIKFKWKILFQIIKKIVYLKETLNPENFKPINGGLFCEKIFGPIKDWECSCKKHRKIQRKINIRNEINICQKCNVQITNSKIRNYRMG